MNVSVLAPGADVEIGDAPGEGTVALVQVGLKEATIRSQITSTHMLGLLDDSRTWRFAFFFTAAVILVLALMPITVPLPSTGWDKTNHLLAFGVLAWLGREAWPSHQRIVLPSLAGYGVSIEALQSFTPNRSAEVSDVVADAMGIVIGCLIAATLSRWRPWGR